MTIVLLQQYKFTALGPMYISSVLKKNGHNCILLVEGLEKDMFEAIKKIKPDLVGFQVFTGQQQWALKYAKLIKEKFSIPIIFGGNHITHNPDIIEKNDCIDFVCRGEGEYATLELLEKMKKKEDLTNIKNIWTRIDGKIYKNDVRNLAHPDELPFPDRELYYRYSLFCKNSARRFITGRGCPYHCTFCHNHLDIELYKSKGVWARKRSSQSVLEEIKQVIEKYKTKIVDFTQDDFFLSNPKWSFEFLKLYGEQIGLPFIFNTRPETINAEIVQALKKAGCRGVALSVETADDYLRNEVLKKQTKLEDIKQAVKYLKDKKIKVETYNMIGLPGETIEQALETLKLNMELRPTFPRCAIMSPYPNTEIWNTGIESGCLDAISIDNFSDSYIDETLFKIPNKNEFINLQRFFAICARYPFLFPLVKRLIKMRRNKLFDMIGTLSFGYYGVRFIGYSIRDTIRYGYEFVKTLQPC